MSAVAGPQWSTDRGASRGERFGQTKNHPERQGAGCCQMAGKKTLNDEAAGIFEKSVSAIEIEYRRLN